MTDMPEIVIRMLKHPDTNKCLATISPDGTAHPIVCGSLTVTEPDTVIFGEVFANQTVANLERDPRAEFLVWKGREGYTIKATATARIDTGPIFDKMEQLLSRMNMHVKAVWVFKAEEVLDASATDQAGTKVA